MRLRLLAVLCGVCLWPSAQGGLYDDPHLLPGRDLVVQLFEWTWPAVANECETFLQHYGYGAVQVSPPQEHIVLEKDGDRPWWIRYQPVSYRLTSRSGTRAQFVDMVRLTCALNQFQLSKVVASTWIANQVERCNAVGVRIIVDAVLNHMVGAGQVAGSGVSTSANGWFWGLSGSEVFPSVPFAQPSQFHDRFCPACDDGCSIPQAAFANNAWQVRNCRLIGLLDLDQSNSDVAAAQSAYLADLINIGVVGFRVDAAKHMWPRDLTSIFGRLPNLNAAVFGPDQRPFVVGEVTGMPGAQSVTGNDYIGCCGRVTDFHLADEIKAAMVGGMSWASLASVGPSTEFGWASHDVLTFIANHDTQRSGSALSISDGGAYVRATALLLAWDYGLPRLMSSYYFNSTDQGPPSSGPPKFITTAPKFKQGFCLPENGWVCEHRAPLVRAMAKFRSAVTGTAVKVVTTQ